MNTKQFEYMVCVKCFTYNQSAYIQDAMNGFCMQKTNFPYVCIIVDDASTDGEQNVIKRYIHDNFIEENNDNRNRQTDNYVMKCARHKTNSNCLFVVLYLKYNHYSIKKSKQSYMIEWTDCSKYTALCEGDDYWIDSSKLQRQFDFMETHPNTSLCFHPNYNLYQNGEKIVSCPQIIKDYYGTEDVILCGGAMMATNSMFFRRIDFKGEIPSFWANAPIGDLPLVLFLSTTGSIAYIDIIMSVYRKEVKGSWSSGNRSIRVWLKMVNRMLIMYDEFDFYTGYRYHALIKKVKWKRTTIVRLRGILGAIRHNLSTYVTFAN